MNNFLILDSICWQETQYSVDIQITGVLRHWANVNRTHGPARSVSRNILTGIYCIYSSKAEIFKWQVDNSERHLYLWNADGIALTSLSIAFHCLNIVFAKQSKNKMHEPWRCNRAISVKVYCTIDSLRMHALHPWKRTNGANFSKELCLAA